MRRAELDDEQDIAALIGKGEGRIPAEEFLLKNSF
jgi:hypothetical protein